MNTRKASRSRLADVLADIKKHGDDNDVTPPPTKRRSTAAHHHHSNNESKSNLASTTSAKATPSYRLRLYDRSIRFSGDETQENIPLYSLIRSWVHGGSKKDPRQKTAEKEGDGTTTAAANTTTSNNTATQSESIHSLPAPKSRIEINEKFKIYPTTEEEVPDIRIPPWVASFKRPEDVDTTIDEAMGTLSQAECMQLNKQRWKKVKGDWKLARRYHEARYEESFKTLHDMWATQHEK